MKQITRSLIAVIFVSLFFSVSSFAAHIIGSDITVQRLSANNYRVTVNFFRDCSGGGAGFPGTGVEAALFVGVYDKVTNAQQQVITFGAPTITTLAKGDACYVPSLCVERGVYVVDVVIPNNANGYYLSWLRCCRNAVISNIVTPGSVGSVFYAEIPDPAIVNSTPVFNTVPQGTQSYMCAGYLNYVDFGATDADGDVLVYTLETPLSCNPTCSAGFPNPNSSGIDNLPGPYGTITWNAGYSAADPMGDPGTVLNGTTGMFSVTPPALGVYVMTVKVEEWRGAVKLGEIRRDFQFEVLTCQRLNITISPVTTVCIGQVATLTGTGALPGWTYSWSPGGAVGPTITGMSMVNGVTTYTAVASNGINCIMNTGSFYTNSPTASIATTGNVCLGQNTTLTGSGAGSGGSYSWTPGPVAGTVLTGVANGQYTLTTTNTNACTATAVGTVYQAPVITSTVTATSTPCTGAAGTATVNASPGSPPYTYSWSSGGQTTQIATGLVNGTHTVTVFDSRGCSVVKTFSITVNTAPAVTPLQSPAGCTVNNGSANANPSGGGGAPYTYVWGNGQTAQTATGLTAGNNYSVTVTSSNGCTNSGTVSIGVTGNPSLASSSSTPAGCSVSNGTATANGAGGTGGYTYIWNNGQTAQIATGLAGGTYTVTVKDANGCTGVGTVSVSATPQPAISTVTATPAGCGLSNGTASVFATGGTGAFSYSWSGGQTTSTASGLAGGNYNITVADANGCTQTGTVTVLNAGAPVIAGTTAASFGCSNPFGIATVSAFGGTPGYTYNWAPGGQSAATATGLAAGNYTVTVTDAFNCSVMTTVSVTLTAIPAANALSSQATCNNNNGTASVTMTGGTPGYTYSWSNGATTSSISGLAPGNYSVTVSDNSCNASGIELVTNGDFNAGDIGFSSGYTVCATANCLVPEGYYAVGTDPFFYHPSWYACTDHTSGAGNFMIVNGAGTPNTNVWCQTVPVTPNTNYTFSTWVASQYTVSPAQLQFSVNGAPLGGIFTAPATPCSWQQFFAVWNSGTNTTANICVVNQNNILSGNDFGLDDISFQSCLPCMATATVTVTQPTVLATSVSQTNLLCNNVNIGTATVTPTAGSPGYTYNWSNGASTGSVTGLAAGSYSVLVTDVNGCTSTQSVTITQPTLLTSSTTQGSIGCSGGTTSASVSGAGGTPGYNYSWSNGSSTSSATGLSIGNYSVVVTDANGCSSNNSFSITQPSTLSSITSQGTILCNGGSTNASVTPSGGTPGYTYNWSNGASTSSATGFAVGNYSVLITDANGCTGTNTVAITQPGPLVLSAACNDSICAGDTAYLNVSASGGTGNYTYTWIPGPMSGPSIAVSPVSSSTYVVTVTDANGCTVNPQVCNVAILPNPIAGFDTLSNGQFGIIYSFGDLSTGGTSWFWDFGDGNTSTSQSPIHTFPGAGTYTVTQIVYNQFGCPDTSLIILNLEEDILIPNVFTPDGDGINDVWFVPSSGLSAYHLQIFDRWGLKVFESIADQIRWDGRSTAGILLSDGTYYFTLTAVLKSFNGDKDYSTTGYITLLTRVRKGPQ